MRLKHIHLAGFKTFVDPTKVSFPSALSGVVGPNGCGKSNIIDAVRWVMGESSAKHLRGESMSDVIFNGAAGRKPVGQASVELVFDNHAGQLTGEYASYSEIAIRRVVNREAQSVYYLNNTRCRRRDIMDIFRGTGLGPRSYAIIEQGMISKLVEAKPEELRFYLEEAAGVTKYKDRRRETELRIEHTRANLARLSLLREELGVQLERLQRQAKAAEKYTELKAEENLYITQLHAMRWQTLNQDVLQAEQKGNELALEYEKAAALQARTAAKIEETRVQCAEHHTQLQEHQANYYSASADVTRLEQDIQHLEARRQNLQSDLADVETRYQEAKILTVTDNEAILRCEQKLAEGEPKLASCQEALKNAQMALEKAELDYTQCQQEWDSVQQHIAEQQKQSELLRMQAHHADEKIAQHQKRMALLQAEQTHLNIVPFVQEQETIEAQLKQQLSENEKIAATILEKTAQLTEQQACNHQSRQALHQLRVTLQQSQGQQASLIALQQDALEQNNPLLNAWLLQQGLQEKPRLAHGLRVTKAWEMAVECVLHEFLSAVVVDTISLTNETLPECLRLYMPQTASSQPTVHPSYVLLCSHIQSDWPLLGVLAGVYCADNLAVALTERLQLQAHESFITPEGIWVGRDWLRVHQSDNSAGILQRQQNVIAVEQHIIATQQNVDALTQTLQLDEQKVLLLDEEREALRQESQALAQMIAGLQAKLNTLASHIVQSKQRQHASNQEINTLHQDIDAASAQLSHCRNTQQTLCDALEKTAGVANQLQQQRDLTREHVRQTRLAVDNKREELHQWSVQINSLKNELQAVTSSLQRTQHQQNDLVVRQEQLQNAITEIAHPIATAKQTLTTALEQRIVTEEIVSTARNANAAIEKQLRELEQTQSLQAHAMEAANRALNEARVTLATVQTRLETVVEQLQALHAVATDILASLPALATEIIWAEELNAIEQRIKRLGAINLAAIDEYTTTQERKQYLDSQCADVQEALDTLELAIQKIDEETKIAFNATYHSINDHLSELFPKVFGGGEAYLELTEDNILMAGVRIVARPPGKRNSSIHLLSGGEKALTAIALVFSFFKLHPSPFCMLDEVDAPLDDANVGRYCQLVKEMSEKVQFIVITHNKVTMEMANHLTGVTMRELGVSRLVSVDMEEAAALAGA